MSPAIKGGEKIFFPLSKSSVNCNYLGEQERERKNEIFLSLSCRGWLLP